MDEQVPLISIIIPVKNGDAWLDETIPAILNQKVDGKFEVLVLDSGSTDNTASILAKYSVKIIQVASNEFNHGLTRNVGVNKARGRFVVMTVQDAKPASPFWLQQLLNGFLDDSVVSVCGQQIVPHDLDKNPIQWFRPISKPEIKKYHFSSAEDFNKLLPEEQLSICRWDNVNAIYKRDVLLQIPFRKADFAEDALWARDALLSGYSIVYNPAARVEHYHMEDYHFAFKRNFIVQYHFYKYFGVLPSNSQNNVIQLLRNLKIILNENRVSFMEKLRWLKYNYRVNCAINSSSRLLLNTILKGKDEGLSSLYKNICGTIPQAIKSLDAADR